MQQKKCYLTKNVIKKVELRDRASGLYGFKSLVADSCARHATLQKDCVTDHKKVTSDAALKSA